MSRPATDIRERAVEAAIELAAELGAAGVTFDAVSARIGASKGAVLHHFRTKDALLAAAVEGIASAYRALVEARMAEDPRRAGAFSRTILNLEMPETMSRAVRGMLAVLLERPLLGAPLDAFYAWCHERIRGDGIDPVVAAIIMTATDGFWLTGVIGLPSLPRDLEAAGHVWLSQLVEAETVKAERRRRGQAPPARRRRR